MILSLLLAAALGAGAPDRATEERARAAPSEAKAAPGDPASAAKSPEPRLPGVVSGPVSVQNRILVKERRFFVTGGATYLSRGDYFLSPGLATTVATFFNEGHGIELRADLFATFLAPGAAQIVADTGLWPDAHRAVLRLAGGYRYSAAYGKVLVGGSGGAILHFELHLGAHAGVLFTDRALTPSLTAGPGLLIRLSELLYLQVDVPLFLSLEERRFGGLTFGTLPAITFGVRR